MILPGLGQVKDEAYACEAMVKDCCNTLMKAVVVEEDGSLVECAREIWRDG